MHLVFLSLLLFIPLLSSPVKENPLFDVYDTRISIKQQNARLDNYAIQLKNAPGSRGILVVYSANEHSAPSAKASARRAIRYLVKTRGLDSSRVVMRYDGPCKQNMILLYVLYSNETDPGHNPYGCFAK